MVDDGSISPRANLLAPFLVRGGYRTRKGCCTVKRVKRVHGRMWQGEGSPTGLNVNSRASFERRQKIMQATKAALDSKRIDTDQRWHDQSEANTFRKVTMKAYFVLDITVHDFGRFETYIDAIPAVIARHHGRHIVQGVEPTLLEGEWKHERLVVVEFSDRADAEALLNDPEAQQLFAIRHATTTGRLLLADGCT